MLFLKKILPKKTVEYKVYKSIDTLPWWNFGEVKLKGDLRYLIILDYYEDLPEYKIDLNIWNEIELQYFEAGAGQKGKNFINDKLSILRLRKEFQTISDCVFILHYPNIKKERTKELLTGNFIKKLFRKLKILPKYKVVNTFLTAQPDQEIITILENKLRKYNPSYVFKNNSLSEYWQSLEYVKNQAKGIEATIDFKEKEFDQKYNKKNIAPFDPNSTILALRRHFTGIEINPKIITVREVLSMSKQMSLETKKPQHGGRVRN